MPGSPGLTEAETRVCAAIERRSADLLDDLRRHVAIPTGHNHTPGLDETREIFTARLRRLGASVELVPGDAPPAWLASGGSDGAIPPTAVCARTSGRESLSPVLIAGHLDTVHDPAGAFRELLIASDGKTAVGPGCVDMKGGLVIAVAALEALEEAGIDASWTFLLNSDEETGTYCSERAIRDVSKRHAFGIALEPALPGGELAIERGGSGQFYVECRGRSAHVGREFEKGVSAVTALARALVAIGAMPDLERGKIVNVGPIEGGAATNAVPDRARAWGNVRYRTPEVAAELRAELEALATGADAMPSVRVDMSFNRPAKPMMPATERLGLAARSAAEALGQRLPFASTGGVCDGNVMQDAGLPTIDTLGVRGGKLHTTEEWIELASLVERCQLLAVLIARLSSGAIENEG